MLPYFPCSFFLEKNNLNKTNNSNIKNELQKISEKLPTHISYNLKKSFYLLSGKSLSCVKFLNLKLFRGRNSKSFQSPLSFKINGRSHIIFTLGFCVEKNLNSPEIKKQSESFGKVILFPLI